VSDVAYIRSDSLQKDDAGYSVKAGSIYYSITSDRYSWH